MTGKEPRPSLDELDAKLSQANAKRDAGANAARERGTGLGFAVRIGVDIVAALVVGVGIGLLLDHWLGTKPWMLILFFVFGAAAGLVNVFRAVSGYGYAAGYRREESDNKSDS
ncbi:MAG TPA: phosphoribosylaminoimidazolecarboxamide formyltransferase [Rhodospirillaceae bacterium]|nr:phosphoribosylaminoimidazolecarboxamide formyltransferase [Rhodospirillaceae bacterium]HAA93390.1 phosphoribosylaminoimidazolecarboxamide formyltransferase [Rhodospirillaceae bacterium]HAT34380.1 phosphoribosylaminoimidazolecarboxamide formyltransferase [Rhodospirillaceae bacterium]|tara:strand:+ start:221 stop:559 length:339 start_codon:yes stop_codon:yes gene_type:complete